MSSISITIDVGKISKHKIVERSYTNRNNEQVTVKEYKVELVPLKEPKVIKTGDSWTLSKTHFLVEQQTKEEKASKTPSNYVGEGFQFSDRVVGETEMAETGAEENVHPDDIPF